MKKMTFTLIPEMDLQF